MDRITNKHLLAMVARINRIAGTPAEPYSKKEDGTFIPNANCYHLDYAYGGVQLVQMSENQGCTGVSDTLRIGHVSKRELYNLMSAFITGYEAAKAK